MNISRLVDLLLTLFFGLIGIAAIIMVGDFPFRDQLFPVVASILIIIFTIGSGATIIRNMRLGLDNGEDQDNIRPSEGRAGDGILGVQQDFKTIRRIIGLITLLVLLVFLIGHMIAIPVFIFLYMKLNREPLWICLVSAGGFYALTWAVLIETMNVAFPVPYLFDWLGL